MNIETKIVDRDFNINIIDEKILFVMNILESYKYINNLDKNNISKIINDTDIIKYLLNNYEVLHMYSYSYVLESIEKEILKVI